MGEATASTADHRLDGLCTPDICGCVLRVPGYPDSARDEKRPQRAIATADRTITGDERLRTLRDIDAYRAAMTCARGHQRRLRVSLTVGSGDAHAAA